MLAVIILPEQPRLLRGCWYILKAERGGPSAPRLLWRSVLIPEPDLHEHARRKMVNRSLTGFARVP
jgi:hypothetical protein